MENEVKKGLLVSILADKQIGDCTNNGLSSRHKRLVLVDSKIHAPFPTEGEEDYLVLREFDFRGEISLRAIPSKLVDSGKWYTFGGNFIYCSDSRFPSKHPIKIFDRVEN